MFEIFVDSGANLPAEQVRKYGIHVVPVHTYVDEKPIEVFDINLSPEEERAAGAEYYQAIRDGANVRTSLVNQAEFEDAFEEALSKGNDLIYISMSKNISGTHNSALLAIGELQEKYPDRRLRIVDSLNASLAQGILGIYAYEMQEAGKDLDAIADKIQSMAYEMNGVFTVGDLKYLANSGRIHNYVAVIGNVLKIKPLLKGNKDGYIVQFRRSRGRKKSLNDLIDLVCDNIINPEEQIIGIAHADAYEESLYVMDEIQKRVKVREFINTSYDYTTGSHVGPDAIALFFMGKDRELEGK